MNPVPALRAVVVTAAVVAALAPSTAMASTWTVDDEAVGFGTPTLHASYLHTHWAGHPQLAQRFADAAHAHARG